MTNLDRAVKLIKEYDALLEKSIKMNNELLKILRELNGEKNEQDE
tara:strand:- start:1918 stop:2052 length:135 start_codon:yes stop_codon:yes gene_type:complete